jgi:hypothetical protein
MSRGALPGQCGQTTLTKPCQHGTSYSLWAQKDGVHTRGYHPLLKVSADFAFLWPLQGAHLLGRAEKAAWRSGKDFLAFLL